MLRTLQKGDVNILSFLSLQKTVFDSLWPSGPDLFTQPSPLFRKKYHSSRRIVAHGVVSGVLRNVISGTLF